MAKTKKANVKTTVDNKTHMGYNEKNPTQPQGAFKAASMETPVKPVKKKNKTL